MNVPGRTSEAGFTLVELLVSSAMAIALIGVTVMLVTSALQSEPRSSSRSTQIEAGRVMLERVTRELRQGSEVTPPDATGQEITLTTEACDQTSPCQVRYACAGGACSRTEMPAGGGSDGVETRMVSGLVAGEPVFIENDDEPNYVEVRLSFPRAEGGEAVTLSDGVALRNFGTGGESGA